MHDRVLIVKPSALGDIMHALPVLIGLRRRWPNAHFAWLVNHSFAPLLQHHPDLDAVVPFDRNLARKSLWSAGVGYSRFLRELRQQRFDLVLDLQGLLRTGLLTWLSGAKRRVGLATSREGSRYAYTEVVDDTKVVHAVDRYWRVAEHLGAVGPLEFRLHLSEDDVLWATRVLAASPRPWMVTAVGARWLTKRWPPEHFADLLQRAHDDIGGTCVLIGTRDEAPLARRCADRLCMPVLDFTGKTTLTQLAALIQAADVVLANDTGPLHVAVALARPTVSPFTCTSIAKTGPYNQPGNALATTVWCAGREVRTCDRLECMSELTPARVWPVLERVLATWNSRRFSA